MTSKIPAQSTSALKNVIKGSGSIARKNKRIAASSPQVALSSLIDLYHQTPTFAPTKTSKLDSYITPILAPADHWIHRPDPKNLISVESESRLISGKIVRYERQRGLSGFKLDTSRDFFTDDDSKEPLEDSALRAFVLGQEPPLKKRLRQLIDQVHGTSRGGLAGVGTIERLGPQANEWKRELDLAREKTKMLRRRMKQERLNQEKEPEVFAHAWEDADQDTSSRL